MAHLSVEVRCARLMAMAAGMRKEVNRGGQGVESYASTKPRIVSFQEPVVIVQNGCSYDT